MNANVFVYDGFNTEPRINDFRQLHSRPINRSDTTESIQRKNSWVIYTAHVCQEKLKIQNLACFLKFFFITVPTSAKIKNYPPEAIKTDAFIHVFF